MLVCGMDAKRSARRTRAAGVFAVVFAAVAALVLGSAASAATGLSKIKHIILIMQENRSFDSYFGTYPGAYGIPSGVCVPDLHNGGCVRPFHNPADVNFGGPHRDYNAVQAINGGKMNGFVSTLESSWCQPGSTAGCRPCTSSSGGGCIDVMGYHDAREIPNYWAYARHYVLQDRMFEPNSSWSEPQHLYLVSNWSATCTSPDPMSCTSVLESPQPSPGPAGVYAWTDITWLLHLHGVSWGYYVSTGRTPDCVNPGANPLTCAQPAQAAPTAGIWNPLPLFETVQQDGQLSNIQSTSNFYSQAALGTLPAVSWLIPSAHNSEHPRSPISTGQSYVTGLVNAVMRGPDWSSSAIFLSWDDWGGFFDHMVPPVVDGLGYGIRVPGLVISPYAKSGYIDHQVLSHDAYDKFIEDVFLGGQRLDPATDGRPDSRPDVREASPVLGNLAADFNFAQAPRPPLLLPTSGTAAVMGAAKP